MQPYPTPQGPVPVSKHYPLPAPSSAAASGWVWWVFKAYCAVMVLLLGAAVAFALAMILSPENLLKNDPSFQSRPEQAAGLMRLMGLVLAVLCGLPLVPLLLGLFWPRRPSAWYVGLFALLAGFFTAGGWIGAIPLLAFWCRRGTKIYLGAAVT